MAKKPLVSVVIPKRKNEDITNFVEAIEKSTVKKNNEYGLQIIILNLGEERSKQRNEGIEFSKADYILILDSDQMVSPDLISECVSLMGYGYNAIYIPEIIPGKSFFNRVRNFERSFYTGTCVDVVRFVRRKGIPMFDLNLNGPEDSSWDRDVKGLRTISKNCLYHYDNIGIRDYIKKKSYYAKSMRKYHEKHPNDKVLNLWYRCVVIFIEHGKWKRLLRHPILSIGIFGIILIRGFIWIRR